MFDILGIVGGLFWLDEFFEKVSVNRFALSYLVVILIWLVERCFRGIDCCFLEILWIMSQMVFDLVEELSLQT